MIPHFSREQARSLNSISAIPRYEGRGNGERASWLAVIPILLTGLFYLLPPPLQHSRFIQFLPQFSAYCALGIWFSYNLSAFERLGCKSEGLSTGIKWGMLTGLLLGGCNTVVILWVVPTLGWDILFLRGTPHAEVSTWVMVPWGILVIAIGVELNFRGFLLGRLETWFSQWLRASRRDALNAGSFLAVVSSALIFAFDPFMVATFQHLHWIAIWDGLIWGWIFIRMKNLYAVIVAHAVEVVILYCCIKAALMENPV